jgi:predicted Rossmann fold flavoprotein
MSDSPVPASGAAPDLVIVGAGAAGMMAAVCAARAGVHPVVLEAMPKPGRKLLASGGGRCNLTNTLPAAEFVDRFGGHGRFMLPALEALGQGGLRDLLEGIGVRSHSPDGFRVFPEGHDAVVVLKALLRELEDLGVPVLTGRPLESLQVADGRVRGVVAGGEALAARAVILATGGRGYPQLGGGLSGCEAAAAAGHRLVPAHPGMVALVVRETWPAACRAHTIPRALLRLKRPGKRPIEGRGDLIFTRDGLAGPVILDLARDITPLLADEGEQTLALHLNGRGEDEWRGLLTAARAEAPRSSIAAWLTAAGRIPAELAAVHCEAAAVAPDLPLERLDRKALGRLAAALDRLMVTVTGHAGWDRAMVMRGGVSLKDVRPETLESRRVAGLFFAGEMLDLDGPCGGFNLQWAFSSGALAGASAAALLTP